MTRIKIEGMTCGHCTGAVEKALARVPGVAAVLSVSLEDGEAQIEGEAAPEQLIAAIEEEGFTAHIA
ncbi:MAG TPA: heavy-metal-associated domain-containing protein [Gammaproteobacteria bacterium]|nr:heavy-metal-associated domain-containing protein [Gammaproteobacteria bacterium]